MPPNRLAPPTTAAANADKSIVLSADVSNLGKNNWSNLGVGVSNFINIFNPEVVVLAGFLSSLYRFDQKYFHAVLRLHTIPAALEGAQVFVAELGSNTLAIGASELIFEDLIADPSALSQISRSR